MKILLFNITGKTGSTGKIVTELRNYLLKNKHEVIVAHGVDQISDDGYYKISKRVESALFRRLTYCGRAVYKGNPFSLMRIKKIIKVEKPDIVHLHCINGYCVNIYKLLSYLSFKKIRTVITHHAEFYYTGSCAYSFECDKYINNECYGCDNLMYATSNRFFADAHRNWISMFNSVNNFRYKDLVFVAVSPWVCSRSLLSPIVNRYKCETVYNGVDINTFFYKNNVNIKYIRRLNLKEQKVVLYVSSSFSPQDKNSVKGGNFVCEIAKLMSNVKFVVVSSSIGKYEQLPSNLYIWGKVLSQEELSQLYSLANVTLLTSKRETFSMVVAESLCCGTPVVGFEAGGPESIALSEYCCFVEYGNISKLHDALVNMLNIRYDKTEVSKKSITMYSNEQMGKRYLDIYNSLLHG